MNHVSFIPTKDGMYIWRLVSYTHIYHQSKKYKTMRSCRINYNNFKNVFWYGEANIIVCKSPVKVR